jgi:hypothetical protein
MSNKCANQNIYKSSYKLLNLDNFVSPSVGQEKHSKMQEKINSQGKKKKKKD